MLSNIYLLKFNNYYNRQVKKYDSLSGYSSYLCAGVLSTNPLTGVNFIPNDGVNTTQVINWDGETPDYLLVCEDRTIVSRWFIIESVRQLNGQFRLTLQRDLVADYYDKIIEAPMFIEKGCATITHNNPLQAGHIAQRSFDLIGIFHFHAG